MRTHLALSLATLVLVLAGCGGRDGGGGGGGSTSGFDFSRQSESDDFGTYNLASDGLALTEPGVDVTDPVIYFDAEGNAVICMVGRKDGGNGDLEGNATTLWVDDTFELLLSYYRSGDGMLTRPQAVSGGDGAAPPSTPIVLFRGTDPGKGDAVIVWVRDEDNANGTLNQAEIFYTTFDAGAVSGTENGFNATGTSLGAAGGTNDSVRTFGWCSDGVQGLVRWSGNAAGDHSNGPLFFPEYNRHDTPDRTTYAVESSTYAALVWLQDDAGDQYDQTGADTTYSSGGTANMEDEVTDVFGAVWTWTGTTGVGSFGSIQPILDKTTGGATTNIGSPLAAGADFYDAGTTGTPDATWTFLTYGRHVLFAVLQDDDDGAADQADITPFVSSFINDAFTTPGEVRFPSLGANADPTDAVLQRFATLADREGNRIWAAGSDEDASASNPFVIFQVDPDTATADDTDLVVVQLDNENGGVEDVDALADNTNLDDVTGIYAVRTVPASHCVIVLYAQENAGNAGVLPYLNEVLLVNATTGSTSLGGIVPMWASGEGGLTQSAAANILGNDAGGAFRGGILADTPSNTKKVPVWFGLRDTGAAADMAQDYRFLFNLYEPEGAGGAGGDLASALAVTSGHSGGTTGGSDGIDCLLYDAGSEDGAAYIYYVQEDATTADADAQDMLYARKFDGAAIETATVTLSTIADTSAGAGNGVSWFDVVIPENADHHDDFDNHLIVWAEDQTATITQDALRSKRLNRSAEWSATAFADVSTWQTSLSTGLSRYDIDGGGIGLTGLHQWGDARENCAVYYRQNNRLYHTLYANGGAWSTPTDLTNPLAGDEIGGAPTSVSTLYAGDGATLCFMAQTYGAVPAGGDTIDRIFVKVLR